MHQAFDRAFEVVADGIGDLVRAPVELPRVGDELPGDRIGGVARIDQRRQRRRNRHGVTLADGLERAPALLADKARADEIGGRPQIAAGRAIAQGKNGLRAGQIQNLKNDLWCGRRGSNPHSLGPRDFKSLASTSFATSAWRPLSHKWRMI